MDKVVFVRLENSDDIIIALSCEDGSTFGVGGFIMQRTPKYESLFSPEERGACIEWDDSDDIKVLLDKVSINRKELKIKTKGKVREYNFNIGEILDEEYGSLIEHFHLINYDNSIKIDIS